jgi:transposase
MGSTRRKSTPEFKSEAVELLINSAKPIAEIDRDLGIGDGTLESWVKRRRNAAKSRKNRSRPVRVHD